MVCANSRSLFFDVTFKQCHLANEVCSLVAREKEPIVQLSDQDIIKYIVTLAFNTLKASLLLSLRRSCCSSVPPVLTMSPPILRAISLPTAVVSVGINPAKLTVKSEHRVGNQACTRRSK